MEQARCQIKPAAHPSRIGATATIDPLVETKKHDQLSEALLDQLVRQVVQVPLQPKKLATREDFVNGHLLRDITKKTTDAARVCQGVKTSDPDIPFVWSQKCAEDSQSRCLSGPIGTKKPVETAAGHLQVQVVERLNP
jgi:hypothetical protein